MFFDLLLLRRQHKGRFGLAWIAGTRGVHYLSRRDVLDVNIARLCDEIIEYVCSTSDSPRSRFSLRLSAVLTNGTLKIYRQQAVYCCDDLVKILTGISKPASIELSPPLERTDIIETPPTPVPKRKLKTKRPLIEKATPQSQLERLVADIKELEKTPVEGLIFPEQTAILQTRADEVTLRETQVQRQEQTEEFGILGTLPTEEEFMREITGGEAEGVVPLTALRIIEKEPLQPSVEDVVPAKPAEETRVEKNGRKLSSSSSESEPESSRITLVTKAQVHAPLEVGILEEPQERILEKSSEKKSTTEPEVASVTMVEKEIPMPVEAPRPIDTEATEEVSRRPVLTEMPTHAVEERDRRIKTMRGRRKIADEEFSKLLISTKPTRIVRINRCDSEEIQWVDLNPCPLPEFKLKTPNLTNLLNIYLIRDDRDLQKRQKISEVSSLEDSVTLKRKSGRTTPPAAVSSETKVAPPLLAERIEEQPVPEIHITSEIPEVPVLEGQAIIEETAVPEVHLFGETPRETSTPMRRKTLDTEQRTIEEVMAVDGEREAVTPRKRRRLMDVEPEPAKDLDFITLPSELLSRDLTVEPAVAVEEAVELVPLPVVTEQTRQQDIVNKIFIAGRLTLEKICQRPVNRLNIARAFNDVLILCKFSYVELISKENSSELEFIQRGAKMTSK